MTAATSLIPGLDEIVKRGDSGVAARWRAPSPNCSSRTPPSPVLTSSISSTICWIDLVPHAELARASILPSASRTEQCAAHLVGQLARENEIMVAGPVLRRSPVLDDAALVEIARLKGQGHLLAMTERVVLSDGFTDVLLERGDRDVVRRAAGNAGAAFSARAAIELISAARPGRRPTLKIGQRKDLSGEQLEAAARRNARRHPPPPLRTWSIPPRVEIKRAMVAIEEGRAAAGAAPRFLDAQRMVLTSHREGHLGESALLGFAKAHKYEESIASLAAMSGVRLSILDRLVAGDRYDPILILGRDAQSRLAHGARADPDVVRPASHAGRCRYRAGARELHAPDAVNRRARREILAQPPDALRYPKCAAEIRR